MIIWWEYIYNLEHPHQGIGNLTPYEKLKSLDYTVTEEICPFLPLILDKVCSLIFSNLKEEKVCRIILTWTEIRAKWAKIYPKTIQRISFV